MVLMEWILIRVWAMKSKAAMKNSTGPLETKESPPSFTTMCFTNDACFIPLKFQKVDEST